MDEDEIPKKKIKISKVSTFESNKEDSDDSIEDYKNIIDKTKNEPEKHKLHENKPESLDLEENLICNICQDLLYNCYSIQPCLHSFCAGCLVKWRLTGNTCPNCREDIQGVSKNHLVQNIIDKYAKNHKRLVKSDSMKKASDDFVEKHKDYLLSGKSNLLNNVVDTRYCCPVCNYPINAPINSANTLPVGVSVQCDLSMRHIQCSCCMRWIVERPELKIRCMSCGLVSCHLVYNECINCNGGCLHLFRDYLKDPNLNLCHNSVPTFIRDNYFESSILRDYLNAQGKSPKEMYNEALQQLDNGEIDLRYNSTQGSSNQSNATSSSHQLVYCTECNEKQRDLLTFQYYRHIPRSQLPHEVRDRVDCYYGYLCRTQRHLLNHAIQYNHACDPTRPVN